MTFCLSQFLLESESPITLALLEPLDEISDLVDLLFDSLDIALVDIPALDQHELEFPEVFPGLLKFGRGVGNRVALFGDPRHIMCLVKYDDRVLQIFVKHNSVLPVGKVVVRQKHDVGVFNHLPREVKTAEVLVLTFLNLKITICEQGSYKVLNVHHFSAVDCHSFLPDLLKVLKVGAPFDLGEKTALVILLRTIHVIQVRVDTKLVSGSQQRDDRIVASGLELFDELLDLGMCS